MHWPCWNSVLQILLTLVLVVCLFHIFRQVVSTVYFFGNRGQTFDKMLIILSDDRKMKTGIKDMWIKIKCQCCHPSLKCSYKSWFMICQFLSPFMQWVVEGWPAVLAWPTAELSRSCKIFLQAAVILTRKGGGGAGRGGVSGYLSIWTEIKLRATGDTVDKINCSLRSVA